VIAVDAGRTYSETRLWNQSGAIVGSLTQQRILRPKPLRGAVHYRLSGAPLKSEALFVAVRGAPNPCLTMSRCRRALCQKSTETPGIGSFRGLGFDPLVEGLVLLAYGTLASNISSFLALMFWSRRAELVMVELGKAFGANFLS
jgi:hypothetical protein